MCFTCRSVLKLQTGIIKNILDIWHAVPPVGRDLLRTQVEREVDWHQSSGSTGNTVINIDEWNTRQYLP